MSVNVRKYHRTQISQKNAEKQSLGRTSPLTPSMEKFVKDIERV